MPRTDIPVRLETQSFVTTREVLEEMLDRARRDDGDDDNDAIIESTRGLYGVEDQGTGGQF